MGYLQALDMADQDVSLEVAISWHLTSNHYPPVPTSMVGPCVEAIGLVSAEQSDGLVDLPEGITFRDATQAPAWAIVDQHHLEPWVSYGEDQFDPSGDCVAVDYERCPACGEEPDFCQGHGEIGDNDGFVIVQAHENGIHDHCLTVEDVLGREVR